MASLFETPETTKLEMGNGHWLLIRKRLTAGEQRKMYARMVKSMRANGATDLDPETVGFAQVAAYLLDWSLLDPSDKPVIVRGKSPEEVVKILQGLKASAFGDMFTAIQTHEAAMEAERDEEKKIATGESAS